MWGFDIGIEVVGRIVASVVNAVTVTLIEVHPMSALALTLCYGGHAQKFGIAVEDSSDHDIGNATRIANVGLARLGATCFELDAL